MMKKLIFLLLSAIMISPLMSTAQEDPMAGQLLDQLRQQYQGFNNYTADLTQRIENPNQGLNEVMRGTMAVQGEKYYVKMGGQEIANDGEKVYVYLEEVSEITIDYYYPDEGGDIGPFSFTNLNKEEYKYTRVGQEQVNGKSCTLIDLFPKDAGNSQFYRIRLAISENLILQQYQMFDRSNTLYEYTFNNLKTNISLNNSNFQFSGKTHPGADVVDLTDN